MEANAWALMGIHVVYFVVFYESVFFMGTDTDEIKGVTPTCLYAFYCMYVRYPCLFQFMVNLLNMHFYVFISYI